MAGAHPDDYGVSDDTTDSNVFDEGNFNIDDWLNPETCNPASLPPVVGSSSFTSSDGLASEQGSSFQISTVEGAAHAHVDVTTSTSASRELQDIDNDIEELELKLRLHEVRKARQRALQSSTQQSQNLEAGFLISQDHFGSSNPEELLLIHDSMALDRSHLASSMSHETFNPAINVVTQDNAASWRIPKTLLSSSRANLGNEISHSTSIGHDALDRPHVVAGTRSDSMALTPYDARQSEGTIDPNLIDTSQIPWQSSAQAFSTPHPTDPVLEVRHSTHVGTPRRTPKKRHRSPSSKVDQQLAHVRKLSKHTGAGEECINVFSLATSSNPVQERSKAETENRAHVAEKGGQCLLCFINKKSCSGERPCPRCQNFWGKRVQYATSFTWTCNVRRKLADYVPTLFTVPLLAPELEVALKSRVAGSETPLNNPSYIYGFLECLQYLPVDDHAFFWQNLELDTVFAYCFRAARRKDALAYLAPEIRPQLAVLGTFSKIHLFKFLHQADTLLVRSWSPRAFILVYLTYKEIQNLRGRRLLNECSVKDILLILKHWVGIACGRFLNFDPSKEKTAKAPSRQGPENLTAVLIDSVPELSSCLPPHLQGCSQVWQRPFTVQRQSIIPLQLSYPSCSLQDCSTQQQSTSATDDCFCVWIASSISLDIIRFFDHSIHSLARCLHSHSYMGRYTKIDIHAWGKATFRTTDLPTPILAQMTFVLRESVMLSLQLATRYLGHILTYGSPASVDEIADEEVLAHRQAWFMVVLQGAFTINREFWNTSRFNMDEEHDHVLLYSSFHEASLLTRRIGLDIMTNVLFVYLEYQSLATGIDQFCPERIDKLMEAMKEGFREKEAYA